MDNNSIKAKNNQDKDIAESLFLDCKFDEAFPLFIERAEKGEPRAHYFCGEYYAWGYGHVKKDKEKAGNYRKKGYELGDSLAGLSYAYSFPKGDFNRYDIFYEMVPKVEILAQNNDIFAQNEIADCYSTGYAVIQDKQEANKWLELSANSGHFRSTFKLASNYLEGKNGLTKDINKALELLNLLCQKGYSEACILLGDCYCSGTGVLKDYNEALNLYEKAFDLGDGDAAVKIAQLYKDGTGVAFSNELAIEWYEKGAKLGSAECQFLLGKTYDNGLGVKVDYKKAKNWYELAVCQDHAKAQNNLGNIYHEGKGIKCDDKKAKELYYKAAKGGSIVAKTNVKRIMSINTSDNTYYASFEIRKKIRVLKNYGTDIKKIHDYEVRKCYGINSDESIIAYRVVPKVNAKLEKGGVVFTNRCVYRYLPSSFTVFGDYEKYKIAYDEFVHFLPAWGYSETDQPELVGKYTVNDNYSFWNTKFIDNDKDIINLFWNIIEEVYKKDEESKNIFSDTVYNLLINCNYQYETNGFIEAKDLDIVKQLYKRDLIEERYKGDAFFLIFVNLISEKCYLEASKFAESNPDFVQSESYKKRIDAFAEKQFQIAERISKEGKTNEAMDCLKKAHNAKKDNMKYLLKMIEVELDDSSFFKAKKEIENYLPLRNSFNDESRELLKKLEIRCSKAITDSMREAYLQVRENKIPTSYTLNDKDFFGLNYYHYAILLNNEKVLDEIKIKKDYIEKKVHGYDLMCFACDDSFTKLVKLYDTEADKLYKSYKGKKNLEAAGKVLDKALGVTSNVIDIVIDSGTSNVDNALKRAGSDKRYESHWEDINDRSSQLKDVNAQLHDWKSQAEGYIPSSRGQADLWGEYSKNLNNLVSRKKVYWATKLEENHNLNDINSDIIYHIIKSPRIMLNNLFCKYNDDFVLYETDDGFWYLPKSVILELNIQI